LQNDSGAEMKIEVEGALAQLDRFG